MHSNNNVNLSHLVGIVAAILMAIPAGRAIDGVTQNITTEGNTLKAQERFSEGNETSTQGRRHELVQVLFQGTV